MSTSLRLQDFLPYRCTSLAQRISLSLSRIYTDRFGISIADWRILVTLAEHGELTARVLTELTSMDKVRVSRALASMEERKLVARRPCPDDSRASLVKLTSAGRALYRRVVPDALAWEASLVSALSPREQSTFYALVDKLESRLDSMGDDAGSP